MISQSLIRRIVVQQQQIKMGNQMIKITMGNKMTIQQRLMTTSRRMIYKMIRTIKRTTRKSRNITMMIIKINKTITLLKMILMTNIMTKLQIPTMMIMHISKSTNMTTIIKLNNNMLTITNIPNYMMIMQHINILIIKFMLMMIYSNININKILT